MTIPIRDHIGNRDPLKEEGIPIKVEVHLIEEGIPIGMGGPLEEENILEEDPLMVEDPLMETEDPLMVEDPLMEMEDPLDPLVDKGHPVLKDLLGPVRPVIVQTPQVTLDTSALENTFN